jgi:hypothetical protein
MKAKTKHIIGWTILGSLFSFIIVSFIISMDYPLKQVLITLGAIGSLLAIVLFAIALIIAEDKKDGE